MLSESARILAWIYVTNVTRTHISRTVWHRVGSQAWLQTTNVTHTCMQPVQGLLIDSVSTPYHLSIHPDVHTYCTRDEGSAQPQYDVYVTKVIIMDIIATSPCGTMFGMLKEKGGMRNELVDHTC